MRNLIRTILLISLFFSVGQNLFGQGRLSGDLMTNVNFFQRDTNIKAAGNPLYDNFLSGGEVWLGLRYADANGFAAQVRFDGFQNSNLLNPSAAYTAAGIGMFNLSKDYKNFSISAGHIYDQIGSGILFRAYEDRGLLIDNALFGLKLQYQITNNLKIKGFTGQVRKQFERYQPVIKAINIEGGVPIGKNGYMTPGLGILNRTIDQASMDGVVATINSMEVDKRFIPKYNTNGVTLYNTLNTGNFTWYVEGAYKTEEAIFNTYNNRLENSNGNALFTTLGYAIERLGINGTLKRTDKFVQRTSPNETLLRGIYNWQPIVSPIRVQRVISRYSPQSQDVSELAASINTFFNPVKDLSVNINYTHINTLKDSFLTENSVNNQLEFTTVKLYRELYAEAEYRGVENWIFHLGAQYLEYNQAVYQVKDPNEYPLVTAITPFFEVVHIIDKTHSVRMEGQWMLNKEDYGSWLFALLEYNISPTWSFAVTDMFNYAPSGKNGDGLDPTHYPNVFVAYTKGPHRFTGQYVKQVEGVNCTGGVCRFEPAFSGFKIGITSTF